MHNTYGVGLVGCGVISSVHFAAIERVPNVRLVATCDVIEDRARQAAEKYGAEAFYSDFSALLARDDIDIVHVTTPSSHHHTVSIAASKAGKHSFVTKPIDITLENIDAMIAAARENVEAFVAAIEGRGEPLVPGPEARRAVEFNLALYESQRSGRKVTLPLGKTAGKF